METMAFGMFAVVILILSGVCVYYKKASYRFCQQHCCNGSDIPDRI